MTDQPMGKAFAPTIRRSLFGALGCVIALALSPVDARAQSAQPFAVTLQKLGATPDELKKFDEYYRDATPEVKSRIDANDAKYLQTILEYRRSMWAAEQAHPLLKIGAAMPNFSLKGVDGKTYTPASVRDAKFVVVAFVSNHCPVSQVYEDRLKALIAEYRAKGVAFLAVQPDGPRASAPSEHGYTDVEDDFEGMKVRAKFRKFDFPYLYDGDEQAMAKAFGPKVTPHLFIFDQARKLRFDGRIDNNLNVDKATTHEAHDAIEALLAGKDVAVPHTPVFGCSLKWNDKMDGANRERSEWAAAPISVDTITTAQLTTLRKTAPDKTLIINFWATWCGPCKVEMPELLKSYQWYKGRGVDMVTVSVDDPKNRTAVKKFLESLPAPVKNYQVDTDDLYAIQAAFDEEWQSGVPYTLVLSPTGRVIYREEGEANVLAMRRAILSTLGDGAYPGQSVYWNK